MFGLFFFTNWWTQGVWINQKIGGKQISVYRSYSSSYIIFSQFLLNCLITIKIRKTFFPISFDEKSPLYFTPAGCYSCSFSSDYITLQIVPFFICAGIHLSPQCIKRSLSRTCVKHLQKLFQIRVTWCWIRGFWSNWNKIFQSSQYE